MTLLLLLAVACQTEPEPAPAVPPPVPVPAVEAPEPVPPAERIAARHILITHDTSQVERPATRSREEARKLAEQLRARVLAGEDMAELAREHSDDPSGRRGGFLGSAARGAWVKPFEDAAFALPIGGVSEVVETRFGFHIIRREVLDEVKLRQIVVLHDEVLLAEAAPPGRERTKADAQARAAEIIALLDGGADFATVARAWSDGPMREYGGDLGWFARGELGPAFDAAVFDLDPGQRSGVIESPFGLHVVERLE
ncbi:MAG: peptidylprolyl isomerase [Alphaproteobacteria bacterium]|nr:peptidylprolyl isomerase [Alphaproteobacteria bacterium]